MIRQSVTSALMRARFFLDSGVYVLVDGQYGSTGKGLAADLLEQYDIAVGERVTYVTTNAAPNSGHTAILEDDTRVFTQQLPVFTACRGLRPTRTTTPVTYLNGGAVIDMNYLDAEYHEYMAPSGLPLMIHNAAAMICGETMEAFDSASLDKIASTGKGTGQAMAAKVMRMPYVYENQQADYATLQRGVAVYKREDVVLVETAQGFSLGPNSGFYPYVTSRECTVPQALADAGIHPNMYQGSLMVLRTFPIRVGNTTEGESGGWYPDQVELTWDQVGQPAELTSVTKRVRRVASFSEMQLRQAMQTNQPSVVLLNFCNYCPKEEIDRLSQLIFQAWSEETDFEPIHRELLLGFGPKASDIYTYADFVSGLTPATWESTK